MTTANITATSLNSFATGSTNKTTKNLSDGKFDSLINLSINNRQTTANDSKMFDAKKGFSSDNSKTQNVDDSVKKDIKKNDNSSNDANNIVNKNDKVSSSNESKEENVINDNEQESFEEKIKNVIKDILEIDEDELNNILSQLGIVDVTVLDNQNLTDIVLLATGETDISALMTDENVMNIYSMLCDQIAQIQETIPADIISNNAVLDENLSEPIIKDEAVDTQTEVDDDKTEDSKQVFNDKNQTVSKQESSEVKVTVEKQSSEGETSKNSDSQSQDSTQIFDTIVDNLTNAVSNNVNINTEFVDNISQATQMQNIVNQVVEQIKVNISSESTSMELMLNPENLGKLNLSVSAKDGVMTAQFIVESQTAKEAIEGQLQILKENLENQGVKVEAVEVTISNMTDFARDESSSGNSSQSSFSGKKNNKITNINLFEDNDLNEEEQIVADMMIQEGSSVNFTA